MDIKKENYAAQGSIIDGCYVVSVYDSALDHELKNLCNATVKEAYKKNVNGVIFNFLNVNVIDSFILKTIIDTSKVITLFGTKVVWSGLKPGVISSLLDFDVSLDGIITSSSVEDGQKLINTNDSIFYEEEIDG